MQECPNLAAIDSGPGGIHIRIAMQRKMTRRRDAGELFSTDLAVTLIDDANVGMADIEARRIAENHELHERRHDHEKSHSRVAQDLAEFLGEQRTQADQAKADRADHGSNPSFEARRRRATASTAAMIASAMTWLHRIIDPMPFKKIALDKTT